LPTRFAPTGSVSSVRADDKLIAFVELEAAIHGGWPFTAATGSDHPTNP